MFRFKYCSNYYFSGCQNKPETKHNQKEMCLKCYAEMIYEQVEYGIKYGNRKDTYLMMHYTYGRPPKRAFDIKD